MGDHAFDAAECQLDAQALVTIGQPIDQLQALLDKAASLRIGPAVYRLLCRQLRIMYCLRGIIAEQIMVREIAVMLVQLLRIELFERASGSVMERAAALVQQRFVSDLLRQRVLEAVFDIADRRLFIDEFAELKLSKHY